MRLFAALELPSALRTRLVVDGGRAARSAVGAAGELPHHAAVHRRGASVAGGGAGPCAGGLRAPGFELLLSGVGTFEKGGRVNALWAGVDRTRRWSICRPKVETALQRAGLEAERRRFNPHVTLARMDGMPEAKIAGWVQGHNLFRSDPVPVAHFTLFRSRLGKEQAVYEAEVEYPLMSYARAGDV